VTPESVGPQSDVERRIAEACRRGGAIDFSNGGPIDLAPVIADPSLWGVDRQVRGVFLLGLLTDGRSEIGPRGLGVAGVRITGRCEWGWQNLRSPLHVSDCIFDEPLVLDNAQISTLRLQRCYLPNVSARELKASWGITFAGCTIPGGIALDQAQIDGFLDARGAHVGRAPTGTPPPSALSAASAHVRGDVNLGQGFSAQGAVLLPGIQIDGVLACSSGRFDGMGEIALNIQSAHVRGNVLLDAGFAASGMVDALGSQIGGQLACTRGNFSCPNGEALGFDQAIIGGSVFLNEQFRAEGMVRLLGAQIGGQLSCSGGRFVNPGAVALGGDGATIAGDVFMRQGFVATGAVRFPRTRIGGQLACTGGKFSNEGGKALILDGAEISGDVCLQDEFVSVGSVRLVDTRIRGELNCRGGRFVSPDNGALNAEQITVSGGVVLSPGFSADGSVLLPGAHIGGQVVCDGGQFNCPDGNALSLDNADIAGNVLTREGFRADGMVRLNGARVGGAVDCRGGTFNNPEKGALAIGLANIGTNVYLSDQFNAVGTVQLTSTQIRGRLDCTAGTFDGGSGLSWDAKNLLLSGSWEWRPRAVKGAVDLTDASIGGLDDSIEAWPEGSELHIHGFTYSLPRKPSLDTDQRLTWVRRQVGYDPQIYQKLSDAYREIGLTEAATTVDIARCEDLRKRGDLPWWRKMWNRFLGVTIQHGYRPARVFWTLGPLILFTFLAVWFGASNDSFVPTGNNPPHDVTSSECGKDYPCLSSLAYPVENVVPILNFHQAENWQPDRSHCGGNLLGYWLYISAIMGWIATTLLVGALTGLIRGPAANTHA
jgi:hypothetical protein